MSLQSYKQYDWRDGAHTPKGITAPDFAARLLALPEPSPEESYEASKDENDLLHEATFGEGDQVWATRARIEFHRRLIGSVVETFVSGGKEIQVRAVEFVKTKDKSQWATVDTIISDPEMLDAYMADIQRMLDQASAKMARVRELLKVRKKP